MWAPPPRGRTVKQNLLMVKNERFQEFDGQRLLIFKFDSKIQTVIIVR
jgi:hypothetical protein